MTGKNLNHVFQISDLSKIRWLDLMEEFLDNYQTKQTDGQKSGGHIFKAFPFFLLIWSSTHLKNWSIALPSLTYNWLRSLQILGCRSLWLYRFPRNGCHRITKVFGTSLLLAEQYDQVKVTCRLKETTFRPVSLYCRELSSLMVITDDSSVCEIFIGTTWRQSLASTRNAFYRLFSRWYLSIW